MEYSELRWAITKLIIVIPLLAGFLGTLGVLAAMWVVEILKRESNR